MDKSTKRAISPRNHLLLLFINTFCVRNKSTSPCISTPFFSSVFGQLSEADCNESLCRWVSWRWGKVLRHMNMKNALPETQFLTAASETSLIIIIVVFASVAKACSIHQTNKNLRSGLFHYAELLKCQFSCADNCLRNSKLLKTFCNAILHHLRSIMIPAGGKSFSLAIQFSHRANFYLRSLRTRKIIVSGAIWPQHCARYSHKN